MTKPIVIKSREQWDFTGWFLIALEELGNYARMEQISDKLDEYIGLNLIHIDFPRWQYHMGWAKTKLQKAGVISQKNQGNFTFWSIIE